MVHSFRPTIFSAERRFELQDGTLRWTDGAAARSVALRDIAVVRIYRQAHGRGRQTLRRTILSLGSGESVVVQSIHYVSLGVIEDRAASYRALVGALLAQLVAANPQVKIVLGHSWWVWTIWLALLIGAGGVLVAGMLMFTALDFPLAAVMYLGIVMALVPAVWRVVTRSRPRPADPRALPPDVLD